MMRTISLQALLGAGTVAVVAMAGTSSAEAISLYTSDGAFTSTVGATTIDFSGAPLGPSSYTENGVTYSGSGGFVQGSVSGQFAAPPSQLPEYNNTNNTYLTLGGINEPGPVSITLPGLSNYFGLYWGSVDAYNFIEFFKKGVSVGIFNGNQVINGANGDQQVNGARYVNFTSSSSSDYFDSIVLRSTSAAFESDNHAFREVPTPALLPGLIGLGVAALRRKQDETAEENA
ncbi:PTPA-CTERM sorting domain-containing protein [Nodosilinea sp. LEGE 07298]|uniref:PTPA-CTERM sorting domain-containing protein n=1 Tax=Nodosilinea sp. LEGE 07298 TaxID=2777970 RepID=UPI0018809F5A|nr:PTPA-CTERM sorting domain-containing protein [Nodosilinea sp. LEGE 07298]MBE9112161.1 PTPA-CTERM sorting domain-containing protein [Nodosilinea sp. LEGE 07298]